MADNESIVKILRMLDGIQPKSKHKPSADEITPDLLEHKDLEEPSDWGPLETFNPSYKKPYKYDPEIEDIPTEIAGPKRGAKSTGQQRGPKVAHQPNKQNKSPAGNNLSNMELQAILGSDQHDKETKDLAKLLGDYDKSSKKRRMSDISTGITGAGMEFGHAFGGQPVDQEYLKGRYARNQTDSKDVEKKQELSNKHMDQTRKNRKSDQDQMINAQKMDETGLDINKKQLAIDDEEDRRDPDSVQSMIAREVKRKLGHRVDDSESARDILGSKDLIKEYQDETQSLRHENRSDARTDKIVGNQNMRNTQDVAGGIAKSIIATDSSSSKAGAARQDKLTKDLGERIVFNRGMHKDGNGKFLVPHHQEASNAKGLAGEYNAIVPIMTKMIKSLETDPRNFWATGEWARNKSRITSILQSTNKLNGNGVMNANDWVNLGAEVGSPDSMVQWINQGGLATMKEFFINSNGKYESKMNALGYPKGAVSIGEISTQYNAGGGGSGSGGNTLQGTQEALDSVMGTALPGVKVPMGTRSATATGPQAPIPEPSSKASEVRKRIKAMREAGK